MLKYRLARLLSSRKQSLYFEDQRRSETQDFQSGYGSYTALDERDVNPIDTFQLEQFRDSTTIVHRRHIHSPIRLPLELDRHLHADTPGGQAHPFLLVHARAGIISLKQRTVHPLRFQILDELLCLLSPGECVF